MSHSIWICMILIESVFCPVLPEQVEWVVLQAAKLMLQV